MKLLYISMDNFECPKCGSKDIRYIGYKNNTPYCRRCLMFKGERVLSLSASKSINAELCLKYPLSKEQEDISKKLKENYIKGINTLVYAVCGAGKTELVYKTILYALNNGKKVGFAIPRREVVIELYERLQESFKHSNIIAVYGGHNEVLDGDLIILTTHQLFRYQNYFDLLILDELDAFPYKGDDMLERFLYQSIKGHYIFMSATPSEELLDQFKCDKDKELITLMKRYHGDILPVPRFIQLGNLISVIAIILRVKKYQKEGKQVFIFCPTIKICRKLYSLIRLFLTKGECVHSKKKDKEKCINDFKEGKLSYLVTTSILERGVTVKNLQVIVYMSDHNIFSSSQLVQISGRVGRKIGFTKGDVICYGKEETDEITRCIATIKDANASV